MKVISKNSMNTFLKVAKEVEKEASLWRFMVIRTAESAESSISLIKLALSKIFDEYSLIITVFESSDIFILSKGDNKQLSAATQKIEEQFSEIVTSIETIDLSVDWKKFVGIVKEKRASEITLEKEQNKKEEDIRKLNFNITQAEVNEALAKRKNRAEQLVLLVDDEPLTLQVINKSLHGYKTIHAQDSQQALEQYFIHAPDIVFLDIDMPIASGHKVLEIIKKLDPHAYIVMLSGNSVVHKIKKSIELGAEGFVGKPFSRQKLVEYINRYNKKAL